MPNSYTPTHANDLSKALNSLCLEDGDDAWSFEEEVRSLKPHTQATKRFIEYESHPRYAEALAYVRQVQEFCWALGRPEMYSKFLEALRRLRHQKLSVIGLRDEMAHNFEHAPELYAGFMKFMPHLGRREDRYLLRGERYNERMELDDEVSDEECMDIDEQLNEEQPRRDD